MLFSRQNSETFDMLHAFFLLTVTKLSTRKNNLGFLAHPLCCAIAEILSFTFPEIEKGHINLSTSTIVSLNLAYLSTSAVK